MRWPTLCMASYAYLVYTVQSVQCEYRCSGRNQDLSMSTRRLFRRDYGPSMRWFRHSWLDQLRESGMRKVETGHTRSSHSGNPSPFPSSHFQELQSTSQNDKSFIISFGTDYPHLLDFTAQRMLRVNRRIREVVQPVDAFVGEHEQVGGGKMDQNRLGQVPLCR